MVSKNEQEYKTLQKPENLTVLNNTIAEIKKGVSVNVEYKEEKKELSMEELLKQKLGDDLNIN